MKFASVLGLAAVAAGLSPIIPDLPVRSASGPAASVQDIPAGAPVFELDPSWPAVPDRWVLGEVSSIGVDDRGRILLLHRPRSAPPAERSRAAPPVLEFDIAGNFLGAWGGAGAGYEWPEREHGIHVDHEGSVWIGGNYCPERDLPALEPVSDDQLLKFSRSGEFLLQIGRSDGSDGSGDIRNVRQPGDQAVYPPTNEVFVADGYGNRRMVVFDADTGEFRRMWGAFGNDPVDSYECPPSLDPPVPGGDEGPPQFHIVHAVSISGDGLVYVADREFGRVQIFDIDGGFVEQVFMPDNAGPGDVAFSADPSQEFMYVAAGSRTFVMDRRSLEVLYWFEGSGHHIATDAEGNLYTAETGQRRARKFVFMGLAGPGR